MKQISKKRDVEKYINLAFKNYPAICTKCHSYQDLEVHHKDDNRNNNDIANLQILCHNCHLKIHGIRERESRVNSRTQKGNSKFAKGTRRRK